MAFKKVLGCLVIALTLTGCAAHKLQIVAREVADQTWLSFLKDGNTTKAEVLSRLEEPSAQFEEGRILTYRLDDRYGVVVPPAFYDRPSHVGVWGLPLYSDSRPSSERLSVWERARYSLVLVFDAAGILQRHSLVRVR